MQDREQEKLYRTSRIIIAAMTFITFSIMFINEDLSWMILPPVFALIAFGVSYPSSVISRWMINVTDKFSSKILRVLYYAIALPLISFLLFYVIYTIMVFAVDNIPSADLGVSLIGLLFVIVGTIFIVVPYIQTLILLFLKHFIRK